MEGFTNSEWIFIYCFLGVFIVVILNVITEGDFILIVGAIIGSFLPEDWIGEKVPFEGYDIDLAFRTTSPAFRNVSDEEFQTYIDELDRKKQEDQEIRQAEQQRKLEERKAQEMEQSQPENSNKNLDEDMQARIERINKKREAEASQQSDDLEIIIDTPN